VDSAVQKELINRLSDLRYNPPPTTHAGRPKKKDKLPAGSAYTCPAVEEDVAEEMDSDTSDSNSSYNSDEDSDHLPAHTSSKLVSNTSKRVRVSSCSSDSSAEEFRRREDIDQIVAKLKQNFKKKTVQQQSQHMREGPKERSSCEDEDEDQSALEDMPDQEDHPAPEDGPLQEDLPAQEPAPRYPPESFVVALYQGDWFVGQVMNKDGNPEAEMSEDYILVSFMEKMKGDLLKWPRHLDILNVLKVGLILSLIAYLCHTF
jgi:hypothetical protein